MGRQLETTQKGACSEGSRIASIFREHADIFDCPLPDILSGVDDPLFGFVYSRAVPAECLPCEALDDEQIQQLLPFYKALPAKRPPSVRWENPPVTSTVDPPGLDSFAVPTGHKWSRLLWVLRWCVAEENAFEDRFQAFIPHLFHFVLRGGALAHGVKYSVFFATAADFLSLPCVRNLFASPSPSTVSHPSTTHPLDSSGSTTDGVMSETVTAPSPGVARDLRPCVPAFVPNGQPKETGISSENSRLSPHSTGVGKAGETINDRLNEYNCAEVFFRNPAGPALLPGASLPPEDASVVFQPGSCGEKVQTRALSEGSGPLTSTTALAGRCETEGVPAWTPYTGSNTPCTVTSTLRNVGGAGEEPEWAEHSVVTQHTPADSSAKLGGRSHSRGSAKPVVSPMFQSGDLDDVSSGRSLPTQEATPESLHVPDGTHSYSDGFFRQKEVSPLWRSSIVDLTQEENKRSLLAAVALAILAGIESAMRTFPSLRGDPKTATKLWRKALLKSGVMGAVLSLLCSVRWLQHEEGGACAPANNASRSAVRVALLARWGARIVAHFRSAGGATVFFPKQALFAVQVIEGCAAAAARAAQEAKHSDAWRKVLAQESAGLTRFYADLVSSARADEFATERNCADIDDDEWETGNLSVADDPHDTTLNTARNMRQKRYLDFLAGKVDLRWCSFAEAREKLSFFPFISLNYSSVDDYLLGSDCAEQCLRLTLLDALRILSRMSEGVSAAYGKMSPTPPLHAAVFELEQAKVRAVRHLPVHLTACMRKFEAPSGGFEAGWHRSALCLVKKEADPHLAARGEGPSATFQSSSAAPGPADLVPLLSDWSEEAVLRLLKRAVSRQLPFLAVAVWEAALVLFQWSLDVWRVQESSVAEDMLEIQLQASIVMTGIARDAPQLLRRAEEFSNKGTIGMTASPWCNVALGVLGTIRPDTDAITVIAAVNVWVVCGGKNVFGSSSEGRHVASHVAAALHSFSRDASQIRFQCLAAAICVQEPEEVLRLLPAIRCSPAFLAASRLISRLQEATFTSPLFLSWKRWRHRKQQQRVGNPSLFPFPSALAPSPRLLEPPVSEALDCLRLVTATGGSSLDGFSAIVSVPGPIEANT
ncbi:hypothetical protein DIPPA_59011 [Diplonema papillatum]|nr:hypothetical protein DIPPA_59011 [Diplonema papillatum]